MPYGDAGSESLVLVAGGVGAVDRGRRGKHEAPDPGPPAGFDQAAGGKQVARGVELEVGPTAHQPGQRGFVDDGVGTVQPRVEFGGAQVHLREPVARLRPRAQEVGLLERARVRVDEGIDPDDVVPLGEEPVDQRRSDEPGRTRDDDPHSSSRSAPNSTGRSIHSRSPARRERVRSRRFHPSVDVEIHLQRRVEVGEVGPLWRAARLAPLDGAAQRGLGDGRGLRAGRPAHVLVPVEPSAPWPNVDVGRRSSRSARRPSQAHLGGGVLVAHHSTPLPHQVAQPCAAADAPAGARSSQRVQSGRASSLMALRERVKTSPFEREGSPPLRRRAVRSMRRLRERVSAEPVRAMEAAVALAGGVEAGHPWVAWVSGSTTIPPIV